MFWLAQTLTWRYKKENNPRRFLPLQAGRNAPEPNRRNTMPVDNGGVKLSCSANMKRLPKGEPTGWGMEISMAAEFAHKSHHWHTLPFIGIGAHCLNTRLRAANPAPIPRHWPSFR
jgi:hypothetical protein